MSPGRDVPTRPVPPSPAADASLASCPPLHPRSDLGTRRHRRTDPTLAMKGPLRGGMFSRHVKRHPGLVPLIGFISVGLGSAVLYLLRLALYSPDVSWDRKNNPEPWNKLSPTDQYKFLAVSTDYKNLKKDRPSF
ncbi:NADH dehydrogenase [ubiquinone] 1 alpha subcomplex subunit 4-like 2 [Chamaea fasciata]